jgi:hypothetical protein
MTTITTNLKLGGKAFAVRGSLDFYVEELTVGQIRLTRTIPGVQYHDRPLYEEECMCIETGIGSGQIWTYGKNIFTDMTHAERSVIEHQQRAYKERAARDARKAEYNERKKREELSRLKELKEKYEGVSA